MNWIRKFIFFKKRFSVSMKLPDLVKDSVELLEDIGFKVTDVYPAANAGFGVLLQSDKVWARLILERGQEFVYIKFNGHEKWLCISSIRKIIQPEVSIREYEYRFERDTGFIKENIVTINELFSDDKMTNTKKMLKRFLNIDYA